MGRIEARGTLTDTAMGRGEALTDAAKFLEQKSSHFVTRSNVLTRSLGNQRNLAEIRAIEYMTISITIAAFLCMMQLLFA